MRRDALALTQTSQATRRIWLIRTHVNSDEKKAWESTFSVFGLRPSFLPVGSETLALVRDPRGVN